MKASIKYILILVIPIPAFLILFWFKERVAYLNFTAEEDIRKNLSLILEDQEMLKQYPFFNVPASRQRNVASFFQKHLSWDGPSNLKKELPLSLKRQIFSTDFNDIQKSAENVGYSSLNYNWFSEIGNFDHWDFKEEKATDGWPQDFRQHERHPDFITLQTWGALRLYAAWKSGRFEEGSREVRHLANLVWSTHHPRAASTAINILKVDQSFRKELGLLLPDDHFIPPDILDRAQFYFRILPFLLDPRLPEDLKEKVRADMPAKCLTLEAEALEWGFYIKTFFPSLHTQFLQTLDRQFMDSKKVCGESLLRHYWFKTGYEAGIDPNQTFFYGLEWGAVRKFYFLRQMAGFNYLKAIHHPSFFGI